MQAPLASLLKKKGNDLGANLRYFSHSVTIV